MKGNALRFLTLLIFLKLSIITFGQSVMMDNSYYPIRENPLKDTAYTTTTNGNIKISSKAMQSISSGNDISIIIHYRVDSQLPDLSNAHRINSTDRTTLLRRYTTSMHRSAAPIIDSLQNILHFRPLKLMRYTPLIVTTVNSSQLTKLASMPSLVGIYENKLSSPFLNRSRQHIGLTDELVNMGYDGSECTIAILDNGINPNHVMFQDKIIASACFNTTYVGEQFNSRSICPNGLDFQEDLTSGTAGANCPIELPFFINDCFHGNHVAGIAAGNQVAFDSDNNTIQGVAVGANIVSINVFSEFYDSPDLCFSKCYLSYTADQLAALEWLYEHLDQYNLCAINMSLGGGLYDSHCDALSPLTSIISMLRDAGVATVVATGNDGQREAISEPACISDVISVGSVTRNDMISSFSNQAPPVTNGDMVDLVAPGDNILSALFVDNNSGSQYVGYSSGTSMAAPHVAGVFAILKTKYPDASVDDIEMALKSTAISIIDPVTNQSYARVQIDRAIEFMRNNANKIDDKTIPSLGSWGLIILSLVILIIGAISMVSHKSLRPLQ